MATTDDATVLLDLDGTLVDTMYLHVLTWAAAFAEVGRPQPMWRVHGAIGLGSTRLVHHLLGEVPDPELLHRLVEGHKGRFLSHADDLRPTEGALALLEDLEAREVAAVVATSAGGDERAALMGVLGDPDLPVTDSGSGDSKPGPAPLREAAEDLPGSPSVMMVGDTVWDGQAARRAGFRFVGVRCGGVDPSALRAAGADLVVPDPAHLVGLL